MSIWTRIAEALKALAKGEPLANVFRKLRTPPERSVAFTIAVIALGAKMAKADGQVTRNEVRAFREIFRIPRGEERHASMVYNLARQDVAGFEEYARQIRRMFGDDPSAPYCELLEGLFHVAIADGTYHEAEDAFLSRVAEIFGIDEARFSALRARFVPWADHDPYTILGVDPDMPLEEIRQAWRRQVKETHPDVMRARGLPEEAVKIAQKRLVDINRAWEEISRAREAEPA